MNKTTIAFALAAAVACASIAETASSERPKPIPMTEEQRERMLKETGGIVMTPETGPWIAVVNAQTKIDADFYAGEIDHVSKVFRYPFHSIESTNSWRDAARSEVARGATLAVVVGDVEGESSLVVLPSEQIALVNVAALATEDKAVFNERFHRELLRGLAFTFGLGYSAGSGSVMKPVKSVMELDSLDGRQLGPDAMGLSMRLAQTRGLTMMRKVPYKFAVKEGWAPAPTNDLQKAVWDEVKAAATNTPTAKAE